MKKQIEYEYLSKAPYRVLLDKRLKDIDIRVFMVHWHHAQLRKQEDGKISTLQTTGDSQYSLTTLLNITDSTAKRAVKRLREAGYLHRVQNRNMNVAGYVVNALPKAERHDSINRQRGLTVYENDTHNAYNVKGSKMTQPTNTKGVKNDPTDNKKQVKNEPTDRAKKNQPYIKPTLLYPTDNNNNVDIVNGIDGQADNPLNAVSVAKCTDESLQVGDIISRQAESKENITDSEALPNCLEVISVWNGADNYSKPTAPFKDLDKTEQQTAIERIMTVFKINEKKAISFLNETFETFETWQNFNISTAICEQEGYVLDWFKVMVKSKCENWFYDSNKEKYIEQRG